MHSKDCTVIAGGSSASCFGSWSRNSSSWSVSCSIVTAGRWGSVLLIYFLALILIFSAWRTPNFLICNAAIVQVLLCTQHKRCVWLVGSSLVTNIVTVCCKLEVLFCPFCVRFTIIVHLHTTNILSCRASLTVLLIDIAFRNFTLRL